LILVLESIIYIKNVIKIKLKYFRVIINCKRNVQNGLLNLEFNICRYAHVYLLKPIKEVIYYNIGLKENMKIFNNENGYLNNFLAKIINFFLII